MTHADAPQAARSFPGDGELAPLLPPVTEQSSPFFDALREGRLLLQRCAECGRARGHIAPVCPYCGCRSFSWEAAAGTGTVHSWIRYQRSYLPQFEPLLPYVVLCVTLAEGPRMFGRLVDADRGGAPDPSPGMAVEVVFERWPDGGVVHAFTRTGATE
jgi:uncharacterized OB-fold protein